MEKLQVKGVEVTFDDLTEEVQRSLYLKDREKFQFDAARSQHSEIRKLVVSEETTTLEVLDEIFRGEMRIWQNVDIIRLVWNHKNFKKTDDKRQALAESTIRAIRFIAAKDSSSKCLNEMLRNEVQYDKFADEDVVEAILSNPEFTMEKETLEILAKNDWWIARIKVAIYEDATSEFLNEMLRNEVQDDEFADEDVVEAILSNPRFHMEQETLKILAESQYCACRLKAVESKETSSEFLNEMLRSEVQNEEYQDENVVEAILASSKFHMEQETLKVLAESKGWKCRLKAAESKEISIELLEDMYQKEDDFDVLNAIETNMLNRAKISKGKVDLNFVQKKMCIGILEKVRRREEVRKPLTDYLQEILDIIG